MLELILGSFFAFLKPKGYKFFYDSFAKELFQKITDSLDFYLTVSLNWIGF